MIKGNFLKNSSQLFACFIFTPDMFTTSNKFTLMKKRLLKNNLTIYDIGMEIRVCYKACQVELQFVFNFH